MKCSTQYCDCEATYVLVDYDNNPILDVIEYYKKQTKSKFDYDIKVREFTYKYDHVNKFNDYYVFCNHHAFDDNREKGSYCFNRHINIEDIEMLPTYPSDVW